MHGAGSPQAQRIMIARQGNLAHKKELAKKVAGIPSAPKDADKMKEPTIAKQEPAGAVPPRDHWLPQLVN